MYFWVYLLIIFFYIFLIYVPQEIYVRNYVFEPQWGSFKTYITSLQSSLKNMYILHYCIKTEI
jgi:hypothetical protein